ncbi:WGR domain-containing protein [Bradyrhizobium ottawaense]
MSLIRNWGRIGTTGKTMVQTFDGSAEAIEVFARLERQAEARLRCRGRKTVIV